MKQFIHTYDNIITVEKLLQAWQEFLRDKKNKKDVILFQAKLMDNILSLHQDLKDKTYKHGGYIAFNISDPKPRRIHKAIVLDRLLHHAIYRKLYPFFDRTFISDSYSCRIDKGTHRALNRFREFGRKVSRNGTKTCWVLKCDIRKFFANINHSILMRILKLYILDDNILWLLEEIIESFSPGLPLGNLTSQLFVNIYMNEFDQFMKHKLKIKYYIRYADDFVIFSRDKVGLENSIPQIRDFLKEKLKLELHPDKVFIKTLASGVDFLGWINFIDHRVLRTATKRRMMKRMKGTQKSGTTQSYLGLLK